MALQNIFQVVALLHFQDLQYDCHVLKDSALMPFHQIHANRTCNDLSKSFPISSKHSIAKTTVKKEKEEEEEAIYKTIANLFPY